MKRLRELLPYDPWVYQVAEKFHAMPDDVLELPAHEVIELGWFCEWEAESTKLQTKKGNKREEMKARLRQNLGK